MATPSKLVATPSSDSSSFETSMARLEKIVEQMESAQMPLDELLERYEEGNALIALCQEKLTAAEQRIEMVSRKSTGSNTPAASPSSISRPDVSLF